MSVSAPVADFINDVKTILAGEQPGRPSESGLRRIADRMQALVRDPEVVSAWGTETGRFYEDESGLLLVRGRFGPEEMTPIHSHGSWGVIGIYKGRDRYQIWRRLDDGAEPDAARVELVEERALGPGEVVIMPPPPQDIHAQQGMDGEPVFELILFGADTMVLPRLYFDPEQETVVEIAPGAPGSHLRAPAR